MFSISYLLNPNKVRGYNFWGKLKTENEEPSIKKIKKWG